MFYYFNSFVLYIYL